MGLRERGFRRGGAARVMRGARVPVPRKRVAACILVVAGALAAAGSPAAGAASTWPARLFMIAPADDVNAGGDQIQDFLEAPDGGILIAAGSVDSPAGSVRELTMGGRLRVIASFPRGSGRSGVGLLAATNGAFLAVDGWDNRVLRVLPSGEAEILAGTGTAGFSGDGGPALAAEVNIGATDLAGLARMPDGSVVFADSWNNRLRRIRPDGIIETIAGVGPSITPFDSCAVSAGDGGPAREATLCWPSDVLATADGGLIVADTGHSRIRRIARDGTITTIAGLGSPWESPGAPPAGTSPADEGKRGPEVTLALPHGLAQLPNGDILIADFGRIGRLSRGRFHTFLQFEAPLFGSSGGQMPMMDFTGRQVGRAGPTGLALTREGGVLIAAGSAYYLAPRRTRRTLVAVRDARVSNRDVAVDIDATRSGTATLEIRLRGHTVARASRAIQAGRRRLQLAGSYASRPHTVRVTLHGPHGAVARDAVALYLDDRLAMPYSKRIAKMREDEAPLTGCRRFNARRVDCAYTAGQSCEPVTSLSLRSTGVIWTRTYTCTDARRPFQRHPTWNGPAWPLGAPDW